MEKEIVPGPGEWPVDPQEDAQISDSRIWIDGCFDFAHHGHAGAALQARRLGNELLVGVHSDEDILENKGPTVMSLTERMAAVDACRWVTKSIPHAPYTTSLAWVSHYGCCYVGHGDDVTSDSSGEDCYRFVKAANRFKVFKRTPGISTTDLIGRMLLCTKSHFINSLQDVLAGIEGHGGPAERKARAEEVQQRINDYATGEDGFSPSSEVWTWTPSNPSSLKDDITPRPEDPGSFRLMTRGISPKPGQRLVYVDGGFDLFSSGHIEFLKHVDQEQVALAEKNGWFDPQAQETRIREYGADYSPVYVVAGVHDDAVINHFKGINYPIMNIFERGLCVLQCKYVHAVVFSAPYIPTVAYFKAMPYGQPLAVSHGPTAFMPFQQDPYVHAKSLNIFQAISNHAFDHVNAGEIVERILKSRVMYEERQRIKGVKGLDEAAVKERELLEEKARKN